MRYFSETLLDIYFCSLDFTDFNIVFLFALEAEKHHCISECFPVYQVCYVILLYIFYPTECLFFFLCCCTKLISQRVSRFMIQAMSGRTGAVFIASVLFVC